MAEGEELPPVVATLAGDDSDFLAMLERDIAAARSFAADLQAALDEGVGGLTVSGAQISGEGIGAAGAIIGEQLATGIEEGAAGLDLRPEMQGALAGASEAGQGAGDEIAAGIADAASAGAEEAGAAIADGLRAGAADGGQEAASALGAAFTAPAIEQFDQTGVQAGAAFSGAFAVSANLAETVQVALTSASLGAVLGEQFAALATQSAITSALTASLADAAAEAGGTAGAELSRNLSEAAISALSEEDFAAFTDMLVATASAAGGEAGTAAAETLGAGFSSAMLGVDLIAEGLSTVGQSMKTGAMAAAQEAADAVAAVEETTLTGTQAYEAELDAVFESLYRNGSGVTVQLAAAMTEAFQGIEADTSAFTAAELRLFQDFIQTLETEGDQAALELGSRMGIIENASMMGVDLLGQNLSTSGRPLAGGQAPAAAGGSPIYGIGIPEPLRIPQPAQQAGVTVPGLAVASEAKGVAGVAGEVGGELAGVASAAEGAGAAVGGLGAALGGPLMWGLMGAVTVLPMLGNLFQGNGQQAQATAQAWQQLTQAIAQDSDMVGANTVAAIQNELITSGAADTLKGYGVSLTDATAAMAGAKGAQQDINGLLNAQIGNLQSLIQEQEAHSSGVNDAVQSEKQQVAQLQATRDAMRQLEVDVVNAVQHQNELTQATLNAEQAAGVYNVQVRAAVLALGQQAQTAKVNADAMGAYDMTLIPGSQAYTTAVNNQAIALNNNAIQAHINADALNQSLAPQAQLSGDALQAALNYQAASNATSQYTAALNGLYGQYGQTSNAQAAATLAIDNLTGKVATGKDAVNLMTDAGSKNFQIFNQAATAAETYAEKVYQQTGDTDQANQVLQTFAGKLDAAAIQAGLTKTQVDELNTELWGVPNVKDITITLDSTPAEQQMTALDSFIRGEINSINNTPIAPHVNLGGIGGHHAVPAAAHGGPARAGEAVIVGDGGEPEIFVPGADGYITPMHMLTPAPLAAVGAAGGGGPGSGGGGEPYAIVVPVYVDGKLITTTSRTSTQWYKRRNNITGFN